MDLTLQTNTPFRQCCKLFQPNHGSWNTIYLGGKPAHCCRPVCAQKDLVLYSLHFCKIHTDNSGICASCVEELESMMDQVSG